MSTKATTQKLPHRFSESAFRKYEKVIARIVNVYPNAVQINPAQFGLSPETIRGRLRDACTSYHEHQWESTLVNLSSFLLIPQSELTISIKPDGTVIAGTKDSIKSEPASEPIDFAPDREVFDLTQLTSPLDTALLCHLAHHKQLTNRIRITIPDEAANAVQSQYDVVLIKQTDGTYILT